MGDFLKNKEYLEMLNIDYRLNGSEAKLHHCPLCETEQSFRKPYGIFSINLDKGVYHCFHKKTCGEMGTLYSLMLKTGIINPLRSVDKKIFKKPPPMPEILSDTEKFYKWYEEERCIKVDTLKKYGVGLYVKDSRKHIVYEYKEKASEDSIEVFNRKYKGCTDKSVMWTEKGAKQGYYGLQFVDFEKDPNLYVCEGEDDCHALHEYGIPNAVSIPFGANNYSLEMEQVNAKAGCILMFFDCDDAGQKGAKKFAEKAGLGKCYNVILPFNDVRDCLKNGVEAPSIYKAMGEAKQFKSDEISKASDYEEEAVDFVYGDTKTSIMTGEKCFDRITRGIRMSELSILTGHSGNGKTTFAYNLVSWLIALNVRCLCMSFENKIVAILKKMVAIQSQAVVSEFNEENGKTVNVMPEGTYRSHIAALNNLPLYFLNKKKSDEGYYDIDKMEAIIAYAVKYLNIKFFLIDHLHYFLNLSKSRNPVQLMDESVRRIKQWTERFDIHICLIVHPAKPSGSGKSSGKLSMYSGKGSSSIVQESDNFWVVYRVQKEDGTFHSLFEQEKNREYGLSANNGCMYEVMDNKNSYVRAKMAVVENDSF